MSWTSPTVADFKARFVRDFPYAPEKDPDNLKYVTDADITQAMADAVVEFNDCIFGDNATHLFYYLTAYHLVNNIQTSSKGMNAQAQFVLQNVSVGSVSVGNMVVGQFADDPVLSKYLKNAYGQKYIEMAQPYLLGFAKVYCGATTAA